MKTKKPLVSIVIPVYNAGNFLVEALESILAQTYQNWELVCVDDGSTDESLKILKKYQRKDSRIRVYQNRKNLGVSEAANLAISKTKGKLIARMDADDIMLPRRLEKQVAFLQKHPEVVAVGGQCLLINKKGEQIGQKGFPCKHQEIYQMMYQAIPIQQPTMMINLNLLPKNFKWYQKNTNTAEEVDLLFRLFQYGKCANLKDFVLKYRLHPQNLSLRKPKKTFMITYRTRKKAVEKYGYQPTFAARVINLIQFLVVSVLPEKAIYPSFVLWRGLMPVKEIMPSLPKLNFSLPRLVFRAFVSLFI